MTGAGAGAVGGRGRGSGDGGEPRGETFTLLAPPPGPHPGSAPGPVPGPDPDQARAEDLLRGCVGHRLAGVTFDGFGPESEALVTLGLDSERPRVRLALTGVREFRVTRPHPGAGASVPRLCASAVLRVPSDLVFSPAPEGAAPLPDLVRTVLSCDDGGSVVVTARALRVEVLPGLVEAPGGRPPHGRR
ncbi:hypothetical protein ACN20G_05800 [Streptomyces sp. BI20]|uniref:hypothetical protein n=1 Tax=Streptomyces sp. BI20 TaxID=3403460 RepID=UPI003C78A084